MVLDIVVAIVVGFGFFAGFSRGLVKTVFDTLSLLFGLLAAMKLSTITINFLESIFNISPKITYLLGLVVTFILVMALVRFIGRRIEGVFEAANINFLNKLAGGVLQGMFFAFVLSMLILLLGNYNVLKPETKQDSITYPLLEPLPEAGKSVFTAVKPLFDSFWNKTVEVMESVGNAANSSEQNTIDG